MQLTMPRRAAAILAVVLVVQNGVATAQKCIPKDPFRVVDPQNWVNPDNMTWDDFKAPPGTNWADPALRGSMRNFNIALVTVDYPDADFVITMPAGAHIYGNPQLAANSLARADVPAFYRDLLNKPQELNHGHTIHEYWMEDSGGRFGVDLTVFGAYRMPSKSYQYGIDDEAGGFNPGGCPAGEVCSVDLRKDALGAWRAEIGDAAADGFELVFILSAGHDESSTWQEFGVMKFQTQDDVPDSFGPPVDNGTNYAATRYVPWTSWASASSIWPNAGDGSSTQGESSGMGTYAHECSHLLGIGDNYNNPFGTPLQRSYTGPWSMLSRGSFNGPGGPHTRWNIPAIKGGSLGSLHTLRDKAKIGLVSPANVLQLSREGLASQGIAVANVIARSVDPGAGLMGINISMSADLSPRCTVAADGPLCDGGGYMNYNIEVIDRMGADSFQPDSGVMFSKTKNRDSAPFQWTIDANPQDIDLIDFYRPDGTPAKITLGDYRQLADALFHAGTRSGSEFEHIDSPNRLHLYVVDRHRDAAGVLSYTVAVKSLDSTGGGAARGAALAPGMVVGRNATGAGVSCLFRLANTGAAAAGAGAFFGQDLYRLNATTGSAGWRVEVPNALAAVEFGGAATVRIAVGAEAGAADRGVVELTVVSEGDASVSATAECVVAKS